MKYVVATIKPWNIKVFKNVISKYPGTWYLISNPNDLTLKFLDKIKPCCVFFPHWSQIVPRDILEKYKCIGFHETDLPYGRGGSPIQNLILSGKKSSKISAFRMTYGVDSGDVYMKKNISLNGSAQEIFERNTKVIAKMIKELIMKNLQPKPQKNKVTVFKRRSPAQSDISKNEFEAIDDLYDFIRALDAETYPKAFLKLGKHRLEFFDAKKNGDKLICTIKIVK